MGDRVALLRRTFGEEVVCPTQATGPPERANSEPAETEALELEWSGEGESADWPEYPD